MANPAQPKEVTHLRHEATRKNLPTEEYKPLLDETLQRPIRLSIDRRNQALDPQLVWRGKEEQDRRPLHVQAPPLYIQEKVHPKLLIDALKKQSEVAEEKKAPQLGLFSPQADFNGLPSEQARTEFYQHDAHWSNRMILGDSLQVMASLAEREGLRGKVQCIYFDPPYGIKFNSNFQWCTTSRDVKDGNASHITREPEQVKAFRDTWKDGIHSYLSYIRDRLVLARDLLTDSGSIFVQIGDENVHRVRAVMDEVFGEGNFVSQIAFTTTSAHSTIYLSNTTDHILFFAKKKESLKFRPLYGMKAVDSEKGEKYRTLLFPDGTQRPLRHEEVTGEKKIPADGRVLTLGDLVSKGWSESGSAPFEVQGQMYECPGNSHWKTHRDGLLHLRRAGRLEGTGKRLMFRRFIDDFAAFPFYNHWPDTSSGFSLSDPKLYVVQTRPLVIQRCLLMTTDPGDLVLDPTCGSGTTAYVAEQWGRRWITIDTSRVALALARARIMGARYPYYLLADSREGQLKEAEVTRHPPKTTAPQGQLRQGFVYERVPHITLKSIANNTEIDVIWEKHQQRLEPLRKQLNTALNKHWEEWEVPRDLDPKWPPTVKALHTEWWETRITRQKEIDASIAARAEFEFLYDRPYEDKKKVRVAGPFTVESVSPHRMLGVDEAGDPFDPAEQARAQGVGRDFTQIILENLRIAGVQQQDRASRIEFSALTPIPGRLVCAEGTFQEGDGQTRRAGILVGPEFGTLARQDLVEAAREARDLGFAMLIACAFNYDASSNELTSLGGMPILRARMNADLHMADELKNTGKGNLFVIFGEPDIALTPVKERAGFYQVQVKGVDVFDPTAMEIRSAGPDKIACWFIDTEYNSESFFVRHAYFLGAGDPYKSLKTSLKAEINDEAWAGLYSDTSRPFPKPLTGRIAVKVINYLGDEVMRVFRV